jgi:hypothetical protein
MSHLLRCGLVAAGLVLAFAAGFYLKPVPRIRTVAAQPPARPMAPPPIVDPDVKPATALGPPQPARKDYPVDPLDAAGMAMIRRELGHKTTVLDKSEPLPAVLADAQKTPPPAEPLPMGGPMPRLEPPPALAAPMIDHAPVRRPDLPAGTMIRITIRDPAGNATTVTTSGQVTIDLVAPDGPRSGPDLGPMPREAGTTAIPEPLRSVLPVLLGSPSFVVPVAWAHPSSEPARFKWSIETARQFAETPVVDIEQVERFFRRDPFAAPVVRVESMPAVLIDSADMENSFDQSHFGFGPGIVMDSPLPETPKEEARRLDAEQRRAANARPLIPSLTRRTGEHLRPFWETAVYSSGRSVIHHLADPDWRPTTATPESCRWEYEPAPTNFWGTPPLGLRFEF